MNAPNNFSSPAMIGFGQVRHARKRPVINAFSYPTYFLMLPMRSLEMRNAKSPSLEKGVGNLSRNRFAAISFYDKDHGDGSANALQWLDSLLHIEGIEDACGEVWLHAYPRVLGLTFKPVSFWYCHRADGTLRCVVVEVNNTFGERHVYLIDHAQYGQQSSADKVFHVSPFCPVRGRYQFRFMTRFDQHLPLQTVARIEYQDHGESLIASSLIDTSISGQLQVLNASSIRHALLSYGAMTLLVIARIHWQALRLWIKRVPFFGKPALPAQFVSR